MSLKFKKKFAHKSNYGGKRSTKDIDYIVIHYTGNSGDTALNNCKYFQGASRGASAHYFVDGGKYIYKSVAVNRWPGPWVGVILRLGQREIITKNARTQTACL